MRPTPVVRRGLSALTAALLAVGVTACGGDAAPATPPPSPSAPTEALPDPGAARADLAARAALAQDHRYAALYRYTAPGQAPRDIVVTVATDGSWRVDIPGGALGGTADVSIVQTAAGLYQCSLPSPTQPVVSSCVRLGDPGDRIPRPYDPKVQRVFRQWLSVFTDRRAALSVTPASPLTGARGRCFAVDTISASLNATFDVGIYCYADDGLLTAARLGFGQIVLTGAPAAPPPRVQLPGPVRAGDPLGMAAPPPPPSIPPSLVPSR
ncbi:uncharacterized protein YqiB (DUF1249 family) [Krasilnikovia cinnamomea]|uniref:Uncharacterized protein YqiB (DUF1249 family) n=1 Tax=Krasilnikovia cinnamomea TaxID=349313 RepID=A0A4Q7ZK71_9ACTN|nr:hypothetical protein [Krasilnikovia cinnamomea]RZU50723.1 uncharacterized protein YqiB (DUF1249 family) [Krasilnikovia cinnamomea]